LLFADKTRSTINLIWFRLVSHHRDTLIYKVYSRVTNETLTLYHD